MESKCRKPCPSCPWRKDTDGSDIPGFSLELAEDLRGTCSGELGAPIFACHHSREAAEFPCAGWVATHGRHSIAVRIMVIDNRLPVEALEAGEDWPELHDNFDQVIEKLRETWG